MTGSSLRVVACLIVVAIATTACAEVVDEPTPVATGVPVPAPAGVSGARPVVIPTPTPEASATPSASPSPRAEGTPEPVASATSDPDDVAATRTDRPSPIDIARFLAGHVIDGATTVEHVAVDVDGDGASEVVMAGLADGRARLEVAWWDGASFVVEASDVGARGRVITALRVTDLNRDGWDEVLLDVEAAGGASLTLWAVRGRGRLVRLSAIGGCHDGSHVYGVVGVRLVATGAGRAPAILATCDDSPLPVRDWSEDRWEWTLGAYRVVKPEPKPEPEPEPTPTPTPTPSESDDATGDASAGLRPTEPGARANEPVVDGSEAVAGG